MTNLQKYEESYLQKLQVNYINPVKRVERERTRNEERK